MVRTIASSSPPAPMGERIRGEVARSKSPLSGSLPAQSRGEMVVITPPDVVREKFRKVKPLKDISVKQRGWTLDVLNIVRRVVEERGCPHPQHFRQTQRHGKVPVAPDSPRAAAGDSRAPNEFTNEDVYAFTRELEVLADGHHKIRQQW